MKKDTVYSTPNDPVEKFQFDSRVADVFENMIKRSVPGYSLVLDMIGVFTERYAMDNTNCYDLGCSLGASTLKIRHHLPASCHIVSVDNSPAMVERCKANISRDHSEATVSVRCEDIKDTPVETAAICVLNYTLQLNANASRADLLRRIADGMIEGGAFILSEKVVFEDEEQQELMTALHHEFKKHQGYSDLEIAQKRAALENVLVPNTIAEHLERLEHAGFSSARLCLQCLNFATFLAIR
ncbi:MAG: carboxy-S-adenosyl-L-methionine synthase CmoA [Pseudomonadales bacterium]|nr:carboxy-S-adenosyl-L-methionine synthase CmoA [Pseudomonadales bacterium]